MCRYFIYEPIIKGIKELKTLYHVICPLSHTQHTHAHTTYLCLVLSHRTKLPCWTCGHTLTITHQAPSSLSNKVISPWPWPGPDNCWSWINTCLCLPEDHHWFFFLASSSLCSADVLDFEQSCLYQSCDVQKCSSAAARRFQHEGLPINQEYNNIYWRQLEKTLGNETHLEKVAGSTVKINCEVGGDRSR